MVHVSMFERKEKTTVIQNQHNGSCQGPCAGTVSMGPVAHGSKKVSRLCLKPSVAEPYSACMLLLLNACSSGCKVLRDRSVGESAQLSAFRRSLSLTVQVVLEPEC
ncbi:unnamed protein product [Gadus morhua 'NCC']